MLRHVYTCSVQSTDGKKPLDMLKKIKIFQNIYSCSVMSPNAYKSFKMLNNI